MTEEEQSALQELIQPSINEGANRAADVLADLGYEIEFEDLKKALCEFVEVINVAINRQLAKTRLQ